MKAGFARRKITPPLGTRMAGWGARDAARGCESVHDDLFLRALYCEHGGEELWIVGMDILFLNRPQADRFKGALGRKLDAAPRQILLNCSHTHSGPLVGVWGYAAYFLDTDSRYEDALEVALLDAAADAKASAREAVLVAGSGRTRIPLSRRLLNDAGKAAFRPNPAGEICDALPVCLFQDRSGTPISLVFSASCHPSTVGGWAASADYPGAAMAALDDYLKVPGGSLFLQGAGGDSKLRIIGDGKDAQGQACWRAGTWEDSAAAGRQLAQEVIDVVENGMARVKPDFVSCLIDLDFPLEPPATREEYAAQAAAAGDNEIQRRWAEMQVEALDRGDRLPTSATVALHGLRLAPEVRIVGVEAETVAGIGNRIVSAFAASGRRPSVTFPLGYIDGTRLYLPTTPMLAEGGYEAESFYEYGYPSSLTPGIEAVLDRGLGELRRAWVGDGDTKKKEPAA